MLAQTCVRHTVSGFFPQPDLHDSKLSQWHLCQVLTHQSYLDKLKIVKKKRSYSHDTVSE